MNAAKAVVRVQLATADSTEFQKAGVAAGAILRNPVLDDRPRLSDAAAVEDEPVLVPEVADHRGPAQLRGTARASHANQLFDFLAKGVDGGRRAEAPLESAEPLDGPGLAKPADEFAE